MESDMQEHHHPQAGEPRLRVVFADTFIALGLPAGSTIGELADRVADIVCRHKGSLLAIDVRMAPRAMPSLAETH
jgi:hypothetical protein